jgi:hypothetical protein
VSSIILFHHLAKINPFEHCCALAFYGFKPTRARADKIFNLVEDWFRAQGYPPDKLAVTGSGIRVKPGSFARGKARLQKCRFKNVVAYEITSSTPGAQSFMNDYYLLAFYDSDPESVCALVEGRSSLVSLSRDSMFPVAQSMARALAPAYGIGFMREHHLGPAMYAVGISQGVRIVKEGEPREDTWRLCRWGDAMAEHAYLNGFLRDVYPWNFLTKPQLAWMLGRRTLESWIRQDRSRGWLSKLSDEILLWEVPEERIEALRAELGEAGVIYAWREAAVRAVYELAEAEARSVKAAELRAMTEPQWLSSTDPVQLVECKQAGWSDRKLRLFCVACCRRVVHLCDAKANQRAIEVAEALAEGRVTEEQSAAAVGNMVGIEEDAEQKAAEDHRASARYEAATAIMQTLDLSAFEAAKQVPGSATFAVADSVSADTASLAWKKAQAAEQKAQADLLREICHNPFRPTIYARAWVKRDTKALARAIYDKREFDRLPELADALKKSGCTFQELLDHFRQPGDHVRGCWALDLVLEKQ